MTAEVRQIAEDAAGFACFQRPGADVHDPDAALLANDVCVLRAELLRVEAERDRLLRSASWRATWPLRAAATLLPKRFRQLGRKALTALWWALSGQLLPRIRRRREILRHSRLVADAHLFDAAWYAAQNPEVDASGLDPALHYVTIGGPQGRDPSPLLSARRYNELFPDVTAQRVPALLHLLHHGVTPAWVTPPQHRPQPAHAAIPAPDAVQPHAQPPEPAGRPTLHSRLPPPIAYKDPWDLPFLQRLEGLRSGSRHIAYYYEAAGNNAFRYRCYNMVQALAAAPELAIGAGWFVAADLPWMDLFLESTDVLVLCRVSYDARVAALIAGARARGIKVIGDIDDLVFDDRHVRLVMDTLDVNTADQHQWNHWFSYIARLGATLRECDAAIGTNPFLADQLAAFSGLDVAVVPNFFNREQWEASAQIRRLKAETRSDATGRVTLGYFSGSPTHNRDFAVISDVLAGLLQDDDTIDLCIVGHLDLGGPLARLGSRVEFVPFQDFVNLQRVVASVDVSLVPLQDNIFTNCKSDLKYYEAALVDTVAIATPTYAFRNAITHQQTGWLCADQDWAEVLRAVLADPDRRRAVARNAHAHVSQRYAWAAQAASIEQAVFGTRNGHRLHTARPGEPTAA